VAFDWPQDRRGSDPDRLLADMRDTVGLERTGEEGGSVFEIYQQMLALPERITGVHLDRDSLERPSVVVGYFKDDDHDVGDRDDDADDRVPFASNKRSVVTPRGWRRMAWCSRVRGDEKQSRDERHSTYCYRHGSPPTITAQGLSISCAPPWA
jgi:hypothetical protein